MTKTELSELIQRRRLQILIHSCIYYEFNQNLVTDNQWGSWALELEQLQNKYPEIAAEVIWAESFKNFDHSTGVNLPTRDPWVVSKASWLLKYVEERSKNV